MLLKANCEAKITVSISLSFDDGTTKEIDVKKGMYGTFKYLQKGATNTVSGEVIEVSAAVVSKKPAHVTEKQGYLCDPNYLNTGVLDSRRKGPKLRNRDGYEFESVERENKCLIRVLTQYGHVVTITSDTILDVDVLYTDSKPVQSPDDDTRVRYLKMVDGELLVSQDGVEFDTIVTENGAGVAEKVESIYVDVTVLRNEIENLKAEIEALKSADTTEENTSEE
jgi:hypothetical protein